MSHNPTNKVMAINNQDKDPSIDEANTSTQSTDNKPAKPVTFTYEKVKYQFVGTHIKRAGNIVSVKDLVADKDFCAALVESNSIIIIKKS